MNMRASERSRSFSKSGIALTPCFDAIPDGKPVPTFPGIALAAGLVLLASSAAFVPAQAEVVGKVGVDWVGNDIVIEAIQDPKVKGVTCHVAYFTVRSSTGCRRATGSRIRPIPRSPAARRARSRSATSRSARTARRSSRPALSLIWKKLVVNRIYDKANNTLIYLSHSRQVQNGSAKMAISTVPLYGQDGGVDEGRAEIGGWCLAPRSRAARRDAAGPVLLRSLSCLRALPRLLQARSLSCLRHSAPLASAFPVVPQGHSTPLGWRLRR